MKKCLILLVSLLMITSISLGYTKIYDFKSEEKPISSGVTYINIKRFVTTGWLNINLLKVDLTDEHVKFDMLMSQDGIYNLATVKEQAESNNAVAAVNGEFFSWINGETGKGYPVGFDMKDGNIVSTPYYNNTLKDYMVTLLIDDSGAPFYDYVSLERAEVKNSKGEKAEIGEINKISEDYSVPIVYNSYWNLTSPGNTQFWDMVEFVTEDEKITEIRDCKEGVIIPKDGYVICARGEAAWNLKTLFKKGDKIKLEVELSTDISNIVTAMSGGAILVKDGAALNSYTHEISGNNPRTAIGTSKDNKTLYMVTVDGRGVSKGVSQIEMAYLMNELGSWNAVNFDGGGSTTMVGRLPGEEAISILNNPSESRKIINSLGIISDAPIRSLSNLIIDSSNDRVFKGNEVTLKVKGYDEYINPTSINQDNVKWTISGVKGTVEKGIFKPTTSGIAKITATYKKLSETIEVEVMDAATIDLGTRAVTLKKGETYKPTLKVKDKNGYTADFNAENIIFTASNNYCSIEKDGTIKGEGIGQTLITAKIGDIKAFIGAVVTGEEKKTVDTFEKSDKVFSGYPTNLVSGSITKVSSIKHDGKYSLKLTYDFSETVKTRGAYAKYEEPIKIEEETSGLTLWTYTKKSNENVNVKMQIKDAEGKEILATLSSLDFTGWKELELDLSNIILPAKIERIYVSQVEGKEGIKSEVYFDNLELVKSSKGDIKKIQIPENTQPDDPSEREEKIGKESIRIGFYGNSEFGNTLFDEVRKNKLNNIAENLDFMITKNQDLKNSTQISGYSLKREGNTALIILDDSNGGLRITDEKQWNWFLTKMEEIKDAKNLFIILPKSVEGNFSDLQEKSVFEEVIKNYEGKGNNVVVLHPGNKNGYYMSNGIKYITVDTNLYEGIETKVDKDKYIEFIVNDEEVTYQILSIY